MCRGSQNNYMYTTILVLVIVPEYNNIMSVTGTNAVNNQKLCLSPQALKGIHYFC